MQVLRAFILLRHNLGRFKIQVFLNSAVALSFLTVIGEATIITLAFVRISQIIYHKKHCVSKEI